MTVRSDITIKTSPDAIVRTNGKEDRLADQKMPEGGEDTLDFKSVIGTMIPKLKFDTGRPGAEDDQTDTDETSKADQDDKLPTAAPVQGVFGQAILAFQQLLDRQKQEQDNQVITPVNTPVADKSGPAIENAATTAIVTAVAEVPAETDRLPAAKDGKKVVDAPAMQASTAEPAPKNTAPQERANVAGEPDNGDAKSIAVPTQTAASKAQAAVDVPKDRSAAQTPQDQAPQPAATGTPSLPPAAAQTEAKPVVSPTPVAHPSTTRSPITDVQIISDRSSGAARTLVIQLQPIELGTVTARLRLTSEGMHIQLTAENSMAAERLAKDHDALGKALQRAGVTDDTSPITISVVDRSSMSSSAQTGQQNLNGQEQQPNPRANGQDQSGFQGTSGDRSASRQPFGDSGANEREEKLAKPGPESHASHGLVV